MMTRRSTSNTIKPEGEPKKKRFERVEASFPDFLARQVRVSDHGGTKLVPWPWQRQLAEHLPAIPRLVTLKARQLGCSWMAAAYALWVAQRNDGSLVLLVSQTEADAVELLDKALYIFEGLPERCKPEGWKATTRVLKFPSRGSAIAALPSTKRAGRGKTARLVIADEHAFHQWAEENFAALQPTVDAGGQFWIISTANGVGNCFARLWTKATQSGPPVVLDTDSEPEPEVFTRGGWLPLFLPYSAHPQRKDGWWEAKQESYLREWMVHQEYPRDPEEAFVQTGRPVFNKQYLDHQHQHCREPLPPEDWPDAFAGWKTQELRVFEAPRRETRYLAGADVAEGLAHGDWSDLAVFEAETGREVLSLHGHWPPDEFARRIETVARLYTGLYGIERNNHGLTVVLACRKSGTPGLFCERPVLGRGGEVLQPGRPGWLTSTATKPLMIDELEQALRFGSIHLSDALALPELTLYQTGDHGETGAPSGHFDDRVMSRAIAWQMRKYLPPRLEAVDLNEPLPVLAATRW